MDVDREARSPRRKALGTIAWIPVLLTACADAGPRDAPATPGGPAEREAGPEEPLVRFGNDVFSFEAPADLEEVPVRGVDSLAGEYRSPRLRITFDYGWYSGKVPREAASEREEVCTIDGRPAWMRLGRAPEGAAGDDAAFPFLGQCRVFGKDAGHGMEENLALTVRYRSREDAALVRRIFESIDLR